MKCVGLAQAQSKRFAVERRMFPQRVGDLDSFRIVICADPTQPFSEREKLTIDQYLMRGGRLMLLQSA